MNAATKTVRRNPHRATSPVVTRRVEELLRIILDGAEVGWDVCEFVREKEAIRGSAWEVPEGGKPLSESQIRRYVSRADALIAESCRASRAKRLRLHVARRNNLYAKAVNQGDLRTALAVLADLAKLEGLYPPVDSALVAQLAQLEERLRNLLAATVPTAPTPKESRP